MQTNREPLDLVKKFARELDMISNKRPELHNKVIEELEKLLWFLRANLILNEARLSVEESTWLNLLIEIVQRIDPIFSMEMLSRNEKETMSKLFFGFEEEESKRLYI